ncbi:aminodeoxychorismate synthase component I [Longimicrobium sp.]|uniref:aminodeoxychorismate synthase component I n=1 Tax=Longimicrobium sp. TaxID=2029185 RepID=UPI002BF0101A|nr:aminodeoxychorismate synthase component I [Longimicrobium sp.]HSU12919.1 aminodeoxychorismate synthase component I [Longimicrobium sp.]
MRFDSLDPVRGARSFRFEGLRRVVRADAVGDVLPALGEVERAVAEGLHAAGFVAYEAAPAFDAALAAHAPDPRLPLLWFGIFGERVETEPVGAPEDGAAAEVGELRADDGEAEHSARVARIRELIAAGETYQVNLTFPLRAPFRGSASALYRRLCHAQRAAYCALFDFGGRAIVSASPELFFRWADGEMELRPMKGTRPRGRTADEDAALAAELAASPKDRAENLMIVDLLRNDAGRIAEFGGVRVERMFEVERYPTVHQMTSTIRARTRAGTTLTDVFRALFPCGSITGAPKVRTSQVISELEGAPRGVYTGAIGFASPGEAVFSVAIRTLLVDRAAETAELGVGSGITWDSDAAEEYRECLSKAAFVGREPDPALIETFGWAPGEGFVRVDGHVARLARSAEHFGYPFDDGELARRLDALAASLPPEPRTIRVTLHPTGHIGVADEAMRRWAEPVRLALARRHLPSDHPLWRHKTARREIYLQHDPVSIPHDDVLGVNERGELAETRIANVVLEIGGALWTPHAGAGLLPGVLRAGLLRDGTIRERVLRIADLQRATAVWVINSLRGWGRAEIVSPSEVPAWEGETGTAASQAI